MICATNTDGGKWCFYSICPAVYGASDGSETALNKVQRGTFRLCGLGIEYIFDNFKRSICLQRDDGGILETNLREPIRASGDRIADKNFSATSQRSCTRAVEGCDVTPDHYHASRQCLFRRV